MLKKSKKLFHRCKMAVLAVLVCFTSFSPFLSFSKIEAAGSRYGITTGTNVSPYSLPSIGSVHFGDIYLNGNVSYCLDSNLVTYNDLIYYQSSLVTDTNLIKAMNMDVVPALSDYEREVRQAYIWSIMHGRTSFNEMSNTAVELIKQTSASPDNIFNGIFDAIFAESQTTLFQKASTSGTYYIYSTGNASHQRLITGWPGYFVPQPEVGTTSTTRSATENVTLNLTKTDIQSQNALQNTTFEFYRDDVKIGTQTTNANGVATQTYSKTYTATSSTFTYCSNYDSLLPAEKQQVIDAGYYTSKAAADAAAANDAQAKANAMANQKHTYRAVETVSRTSYWLDPTNHTVSKEITGSGSANFSLSNLAQRGTISLQKVDKEMDNNTVNNSIENPDANNDGAQGDSTISGAVYGLYAKNDIVHPDGKSGVISYNQNTGNVNEIKLTKGTDLYVVANRATAGTLLATAKTDANGEIKFENLYLGDYYIQEITPSTGYLLDTEKHDITIDYAGQDVKITNKELKVQEQVKKQAFEIVKVSSETNGGEATLLEDAEFTVKLTSDVNRMGWDAAPIYDVLTTDRKGYAKSIELPYGTYTVRETATPAEHLAVDDFTVYVAEDNRDAQTWRVFIDEKFSALLKAVKIDRESGKQVLLPNTEFKIKALTDVKVDGRDFSAGEYIGYWNWNIFDGFYTDTWKTNENGYIQLNEKLGVGEYQLEEIHAPYGYVLDTTHVRFQISKGVAYEMASDGTTPIITVDFSNVSVKGQVKVSKRGEVLVDYDEDTKQFIYEERGLAGAKYDIVAKEDIMDPSNDGSVLYQRGTVVTSVTTGNDGNATSEKLPLGVYEVVETEAPTGMVLNKEKKTVTLSYEDENTEVVFDNASFVNERQKVKLDLKKLDLDENVPLKGAKFTMYANKDIVNVDGDVIVSEGEPISVATSNEDGELAFAIDLPIDINSTTTPVDPDAIDGGFTVTTDEEGNVLIGDTNSMFFIKETGRPVGYTTLHATMYLDTTYQGQDVKDFTIAYDLYNEMTRVAFSKRDIATGIEVPGAELSIIPVNEDGTLDEGSVFATWITKSDDPDTREDESIELVKGLEPGKYVLREKLGNAAALGYVTANDVEFEVEDTGDIQKVEMKDDYTKVEINKTDITTGEPVIGAQLSVIPLDEDGNPKEGETFVTWITDDQSYLIEYLPIGDYILRETLSGQAWDYGYVTAEDIKFTVEDTGEVQKVEMKDDYTKVKISKTDLTSGKPVPGAELSIIPVNEDGTLDEGSVFATWVTEEDDPETEKDESIYCIERIPVGKYVLREKLGNAMALGYVTAEDVTFEVEDTGEVQKVEMKDDHTKVEISKVNSKGDFVEGATLQIVPMKEDGTLDEGAAYTTYVSKKEAHLVEYLPIGKYVLRELSAPDGYVKASNVEFEVRDTSEVHKVVMADKQVTMSKVDVAGEEIEGAEMHVLDEDGNIVDEWVSGKEPHAISGLVVGQTYTLVEDLAPLGYVIANSIEFTVADDGKDQTVKMVDKKVIINKVDDNRKFVINAKLQVIDEEGNVVDTWVTGKEGHAISGLVVGKTYTLKELEVPKGYTKAADQTFTVNDDGKDQVYDMIDKLIPVVTGDSTNTGLWIGLSVVSLGLLAMLASKRKQEME